jgi:hypothetical protein
LKINAWLVFNKPGVFLRFCRKTTQSALKLPLSQSDLMWENYHKVGAAQLRHCRFSGDPLPVSRMFAYKQILWKWIPAFAGMTE